MEVMLVVVVVIVSRKGEDESDASLIQNSPEEQIAAGLLHSSCSHLGYDRRYTTNGRGVVKSVM